MWRSSARSSAPIPLQGAERWAGSGRSWTKRHPRACRSPRPAVRCAGATRPSSRRGCTTDQSQLWLTSMAARPPMTGKPMTASHWRARIDRRLPPNERPHSVSRPCSPGCRQPVRVILAWRSLLRSSTEPLLVCLSLRLHPAASTSTAAPIQRVPVFMGFALPSARDPRDHGRKCKPYSGSLTQAMTLTHPNMPSLKWTFTAQMTR